MDSLFFFVFCVDSFIYLAMNVVQHLGLVWGKLLPRVCWAVSLANREFFWLISALHVCAFDQSDAAQGTELFFSLKEINLIHWNYDAVKTGYILFETLILILVVRKNNDWGVTSLTHCLSTDKVFKLKLLSLKQIKSHCFGWYLILISSRKCFWFAILI